MSTITTANPQLDKALQSSDASRLSDLEAIIDKGQQAFVKAGHALKEIRDTGLYKVSHKTFEAYVEARFGFKKTNAYHLISAAEVAKELSDMSDENVILNPRQAAELAKVPSDKRKEVLDKAAEIAKKRGKKTTAAIIAAARKEVVAKSVPVAEPEEYEDDDDDDADDLTTSQLSRLIAEIRSLQHHELIAVQDAVEAALRVSEAKK